MIVFDLSCADGHRFEGWFGSSADYADQRSRGLLACPHCGSTEVAKAPMAPAVPVKGNVRQDPLPTEASRPVANTPMPLEVQKALAALAKAQAEALSKSTWVGEKFAEESRAMHYGERDEAPIHGQATLAEAKALIDEGVPVAPLPFPVAPPDKLN
ncbi:DUF1178 family protein [Erythrobacter dokdonensis]|uniref:DUF1178 domain-containing protein n=1 Tax=Erythrobacter dokdonensis DSW-74 TaxID=1300349 RepID=A0A1A7BM55_9SPHN|nr:DUF1178 family protein [Erythrobacter dokdonensis]OBV12552.1 DUF1178 domain-containing protein [Erythrobacter dokdonensis DSW-74]